MIYHAVVRDNTLTNLQPSYERFVVTFNMRTGNLEIQSVKNSYLSPPCDVWSQFRNLEAFETDTFREIAETALKVSWDPPHKSHRCCSHRFVNCGIIISCDTDQIYRLRVFLPPVATKRRGKILDQWVTTSNHKETTPSHHFGNTRVESHLPDSLQYS